MFRWRPLLRVSALLATTSLTLSACLPPAFAQDVGAQEVGAREAGDPPARVGRIARLSGAVSFHTADEDHWDRAALNYPITAGGALWSEPRAHAEIEVSANLLALDGTTELDLTTLDDHALVAAEPQGETYLRLANVPPGDSYTVNTPRGAVQITGPARVEIIAGDTERPTAVTVVDGTAAITGNGVSLTVTARQTAFLQGSDSVQATIGPMREDGFLHAMLAREEAARRRAPLPAPVLGMTGSDDLADYGNWSATPTYGQVWYPRVTPGWVPYRAGHWAYVTPWGWTWVDDEPWGFTPFHYGRWVEVDDRWGWVPVAPDAPPEPRPVYAPALVSFVDVGGAAAAGAAIGFAAGMLASGGGGGVGWVPLGPGEPYIPPYHVSQNYIRNVNIINVNKTVNITNITNNVTNITNTSFNRTLVNRNAATVIPAAAMQGSVPLRGVARPLPATAFAAARPVMGAPVPPSPHTAGVTPAVARQFHFEPAAHPPMPGPAINRPLPGGAPGPHFDRAVLPGHAPSSFPGQPLPGQPFPGQTRPGATPAVPGGILPPRHGMGAGGLPPLRAPGQMHPPMIQQMATATHAPMPQIPHGPTPPQSPIVPHPAAPVPPHPVATPHMATPGMQHAMLPAQHFAPPPVQHVATPPAPHFAPPPVQHVATPPAPHFAPPPVQHVATQHFAPPPGNNDHRREQH
ncbi:MAG TPA: DUF6600 domain-containing protein [Acetobacteraceae bacterium]|nr:DUF6600 domain-containing protein [Acetobacteraceae bacterium]